MKTQFLSGSVLVALTFAASLGSANVARLKRFDGEYKLRAIVVTKAKNKQALQAIIDSNKTENGYSIMKQNASYQLGSARYDIESCSNNITFKLSDIVDSDSATEDDIFEMEIGDSENAKSPDMFEIPLNAQGQSNYMNPKLRYRSSAITLRYGYFEGETYRLQLTLDEKNNQIVRNAVVGEWIKDPQPALSSSLHPLGEVNCVYTKQTK